jgi:hypothetical protein
VCRYAPYAQETPAPYALSVRATELFHPFSVALFSSPDTRERARPSEVEEEGQSMRAALPSPRSRAPCEFMSMTSHEMPPEHTPFLMALAPRIVKYHL